MELACDPIELFDKSFYEQLSTKIEKVLDKTTEIKKFEIFCTSNQDTKITYEKGEIKDATQKSGGGLGLRVIGEHGKEGITFTSDFSTNALELIIIQSTKMMKAATANPFFQDLAHPSKSYTDISGIYDPRIEHICPDDIDDLLAPILNLMNKPIHPHSLSGSFNSTFGTVFIKNSNGIQQWQKYTTAGCNVECSLKNNGIPSSGFDWQTTCQIKDLNIENVAKRCYKMAKRGLKRHSMQSGEYPIILSPLAVASFLINPLTSAINAEMVQNQSSFLANDLNQKIGSELLTIHDEPHITGKIGTESFDAEGKATKPITIVKNGELKEFYHNTLTASKFKTISNGHASRSSYSTGIGIGNYNLIMENGSKSFKNMISDVKHGIFFEYSGDSPNYVSGDFSGLIMTGYVIENGELGPALLETLISINLKDAFQKIIEISKERIWVDEILAPYVKIDPVVISGRD